MNVNAIIVNEFSLAKIIHLIRFKIHVTISNLREKRIINWYCFLIHKNPKNKDDPNLYFHIRVSLKNDVKPKVFRESLPDYCVFTQPMKRKRVEKISIGRKEYFDTSLFKTEKIEDAWRIIGEQSEWVMNMLNIHKKDVEINKYPKQIGQFLHYYFNMLGLQIKCPYCGSGGLIFPPL